MSGFPLWLILLKHAVHVWYLISVEQSAAVWDFIHQEMNCNCAMWSKLSWKEKRFSEHFQVHWYLCVMCVQCSCCFHSLTGYWLFFAIGFYLWTFTLQKLPVIVQTFLKEECVWGLCYMCPQLFIFAQTWKLCRGKKFLSGTSFNFCLEMYWISVLRLLIPVCHRPFNSCWSLYLENIFKTTILTANKGPHFFTRCVFVSLSPGIEWTTATGKFYFSFAKIWALIHLHSNIFSGKCCSLLWQKKKKKFWTKTCWWHQPDPLHVALSCVLFWFILSESVTQRQLPTNVRRRDVEMCVKTTQNSLLFWDLCRAPRCKPTKRLGKNGRWCAVPWQTSDNTKTLRSFKNNSEGKTQVRLKRLNDIRWLPTDWDPAAKLNTILPVRKCLIYEPRKLSWWTLCSSAAQRLCLQFTVWGDQVHRYYFLCFQEQT